MSVSSPELCAPYHIHRTLGNPSVLCIFSFMIHQLIRKVHTTFRVDGLYRNAVRSTVDVYTVRAIAFQNPFISVLRNSLFHPALLNFTRFDPLAVFALIMFSAMRLRAAKFAGRGLFGRGAYRRSSRRPKTSANCFRSANAFGSGWPLLRQWGVWRANRAARIGWFCRFYALGFDVYEGT